MQLHLKVHGLIIMSRGHSGADGEIAGPRVCRTRASSRSRLSLPDDHRTARPGGDSVKAETTGGDDLVCGVVTCRRASRITLPAGAVTVPQLQRHVWSVLREWGLSPLVDVVELAARDSLIAHAVQVSRGSARTSVSDSRGKDLPPVVLRLSILGQVVLAEVWDHTPTPPALADPDPTTEHGRGLRLIEALADRWSFDLTCPAGKAVWCVFRTMSQPTHRPGAMNPAIEALPMRSPQAGSGAAEQVPFVDDPALLQRVVDGLCALDGRHLSGDRAAAPPGVERRSAGHAPGGLR